MVLPTHPPARPPGSLHRQTGLHAAAATAILVAAGCAAWGGGTAGAINSWNGARYAEVASQWGPPTRTATLADGQVAHTWVSPAARVGVLGGPGGVGAAATFPLPGMGPDPQRICERTLTFRNDRVIEQAWAGPDDLCSPYKRR